MNDFNNDLRQQCVSLQIDIISNDTSVLIVSKNHELFTKKLVDKKCTFDIAETKSDSNNELAFDFENIKSKKFQTILLDDTINHVSNPIKFIKQITAFLTPDGFLLCATNNLFNFINRLRFINGDYQIINSILKNNRNLEFLSLDSILLTLSESGSSIGKIVRVKEEDASKSKLELNTFTFTEEILKALSSDSESRVFYYIFTINNKITVNQNTRRWTSKFSKNLVTEGFKQVLSDQKLQYEKHINYLKQTNREQYVSIISDDKLSSETTRSINKPQHKTGKKLSGEEELLIFEKKLHDDLSADLLEDSKRFLNRALKEKDKYLENTISGKDEYVRNALKDKDEVIHAMQNSFVFRMLSKLDKFLGKKPRNK